MNIDKFNNILEDIKTELFKLIELEVGVSDYDKTRVKDIFNKCISTDLDSFEKIKNRFDSFCNNILSIEKVYISKSKEGSITHEEFNFKFSNKKELLKITTYSELINSYSLSLDEANELFIYVNYGKMNINSSIQVINVTKEDTVYRAMWTHEEKFNDYFYQTIYNEMLNEDIELKKYLLTKIKKLQEIHVSFINPNYKEVDVDFKININKVDESFKHLLEIDINKYNKKSLFEIRDLILLNCDVDIFYKVGSFLSDNHIQIKQKS